MMVTQRIAPQTKKDPAHAAPCPCGCAPCEADCCRLECLERPRFFCGQLLTDQDLSALVGWTRDRLRLVRHRDGYGVVCGLEVSCAPGDPSAVIVHPGYAVDCCGDDIVVCEATNFQVSKECCGLEDPCAELRPSPEVRDSQQALYMLASHTAPGRHAGDPGAPSPSPRRCALDLVIRYAEKDTAPLPALARGECRDTGRCEPSRTRETFTLAWRPALWGSDPRQAAADRWREAYIRCLDVLAEFRKRVTFPVQDGETIRRWALSWIDANPLHQFCQVRDRICRMTDDDLKTEGRWAEVLFMLVQDCRNGFLACACHDCRAPAGVPLARVYLEERAETSHQPAYARHGGAMGRCHVTHIDPYPPFRRELSLDCWPAPPNCVNLGRLIWHRWDEACTALAELGIEAEPQAFPLGSSLAELERMLDCDPFVCCGDPVTVWVFDAGGEVGSRVVGFCRAATEPPPPPPPRIRVVKEANFTEAVEGQEVTYTIRVANTGSTVLREVVVKDDQLALAERIEGLEPGQPWERVESHPIRVAGPAEYTNTVTVDGIDEYGQTVTGSASWTIVVNQAGVEPPRLGLEIKKGAKESNTVEGGQVHYYFDLENTGDAPLSVRLEDSLLGQVANSVSLGPGGTTQIYFEYMVPRGTPPGALINTVTATGTGPDGGTVMATAEHSLDVIAFLTDFTEIEDIGRARNDALHKAGITTLAQLAEASEERLREIFPTVGRPRLLAWKVEAGKLAAGAPTPPVAPP